MEFSFHNPTGIEFGKGKIKEISNLIPKDKKVLVVYGGGSVKNNGAYDQVTEALKDHEWLEFGGVEANPTVETMNKAVELVKAQGVNYILAVGDGSVIDGSKYLAAASLYDGDGWDFLDGTAEVQEALPLAVVLTLAATGSESNNLTVVSRKSTDEKRMYFSDHSYPQFAVLDPSFMGTLSDRQLGNGLVDAFVHISEQYLTKTNDLLVNDGYAETLYKGLVILAQKWDERRTLWWQENLMHICNQALNFQLANGVCQDWSTHIIGHELTAFYGLDHARSLAVILPHLIREMIDEKQDKLAQFGKNVFGIENDNEAIIKKIEEVFESVGVPTKLTAYEIDDKVVENVHNAFKSHGYLEIGENGTVTLDKVEKIINRSIAA
ncbi:NADH-dependent alcohol dehydrogenase [Malaciobacter pacificus]|uniref:Iron-containing alcohol dehydrogenase n=1 Tax=Malaciobacter pacificus TaxID=1080223 RepID=A0A5C2H663_9BACT|nr:iron-containing alcohol dehydrogenase [Malaciobacter pacificus]QEP34437.1 iron-containing alcohol dehydrogenase [Malaciobacter pacificus]GGD45419.1 NADH-dependent alcohol dehydrogenase [Malaciobacter pacificus]